YRIEPGEVEAALREAASVDEAAVVARANGGGDAKLVAYLPARGLALTPAALREALLARLPEYMVPSLFVALDAFPRTAGGKIDRRALPDPEPESGEEYAPPETETERRLAALWEALLGAARVGLDDDFFLLGGHSLLATQLVSRIRESFGVELPLRTLFECSTVRALAPRVDALAVSAAAGDAPPILPVAREGGLPLSFAQERLWFLAQLDPGTQVYNVPVPLHLSGPLDVRALEEALGEAVRRHEPLRTVFAAGASGPVQVVLPPPAVTLDVVDLTHLGEIEAAEAAERIAEEEGRKPFDLATDLPWRARLARTAPDRHLLSLVIHHVATDGWSTSRLLGEIATLYAAFSRGMPSPLAELPVQYADFAAWQRGWLAGERLEAQLGYWRARLAGAPAVLELPTDRPRPAMQDLSGASLGFQLPGAAVRGARELAQSEGATLFMALLAAFAAVLQRWSGQDEVVIGTPVAGRTRKEIEPLVGFFANTLALRVELEGDPSFRALLAKVRETTLDGYAHQDVPFEKLVEELKVERSLSHTPLFQVMFALQNAPPQAGDAGEGFAATGVEVARRGTALGTARFDLTVNLGEWDGGVYGGIEYATALFDRGTIERLVAHLGAVLEAAAAHPDAPLSSLSILAPGERDALLAAAAATEASRVAQPLHALFATQAARTPDAPALTCEDRTLTYAELDRASNRLANHLRALGVGPESRVGLCVERSLETIAGILGILKAGGAYVPLDPAYPADRLAYMLEDSGARVVVTDGAAEGRLPSSSSIGLVHYQVDDDGLGDISDAAPETQVGVDHLAYVIYTSGSTGRPKWCMVTHRNVVRLMTSTERWFSFGPDDVCALFHSYAFDVSVWEMWAALLYGGRLVVVPFWVSRDPEAFYALLETEQVTVLEQTPSAFRPLMRADEEAAAAGRMRDLALRVVIFAGEVLEPASLRGWVERRGIASPALVNMYGPTETTVYTTYRLMTEDDVFAGAGSPLGVQIPDLSMHLLDARGEPSPVGVPGEMYFGGPCVARGYLDRAALTAERFVPDAYSTTPGGRLYRTGDLARRLPNGEVVFVGRVDDQVKVRGFRVEPGEVEAAVATHPSVAQAVVLAKGDGGERRLVAYVVPRAGEEVSPAALRAHASAHLPDYMVPAQWVVMDALPLTPSGKVARRALPDPEPATGAEYAAPETETERRLAEIWEALLGAPRVGLDDSFFLLGGHSLLATQLVSRIREAFAVELPLRAVFEAVTVRALAPRIDALAAETTVDDAPPIVPVPRDGDLPLSFAQERLWFLAQLDPGTQVYNVPVPLELVGALDVDALERALAETIRRHEPLRTVLAQGEAGPAQRILPATAVTLDVVDLTHLGEDEARAEAERIAEEEGRRPFDLTRETPFRARLIRIADDRHLLAMVVHHVATDGWSSARLLGEIEALYGAFARGLASPLRELPVQYADFAAWQRAWLSGERLEAQLGYWRARLTGTPAVLELPTDRPRPAVRDTAGASFGFQLPTAASRGARELARSEGATLFMSLLAAFAAVLHRWSSQDDVVIGTP
ncbi:MAG TPA: amino acid adenylation domain-containing protein, partial [Longimicrobium sp.]|nr:amino acid adenylation domain-containing protein [Longimicrobium sp.]